MNEYDIENFYYDEETGVRLSSINEFHREIDDSIVKPTSETPKRVAPKNNTASVAAAVESKNSYADAIRRFCKRVYARIK